MLNNVASKYKINRVMYDVLCTTSYIPHPFCYSNVYNIRDCSHMTYQINDDIVTNTTTVEMIGIITLYEGEGYKTHQKLILYSVEANKQ